MRIAALGDSFTEGVGDDDASRPNGVRGWADRVAEVLETAVPGFTYANLAVRGRSPNLGEVLADHEQYTLYRYDEDTTNPPKSNCVEPDCTLKWIPLLTAEVETTAGVDAALLGVVERSNGTRQVTLNEHPLYRYAP